MTQLIWWNLKTLLQIRWWVFNFIKTARVFSFRVTVHLLFSSFLLQKTVGSVYQPRYESLKLSHDTKYLMTSEDTVECPLISFQFYKNSKSFSSSCYSPSTVFFFIAKDPWICIFNTLRIFKTNPWHKLFDDIWRHGCRSVDECSVLYKEQEFFSFRVTVHLLFSFLLQKTLESVFLPRYESLKLNHDTNYLMTSEDTLVDPLMSFQFYINSKSVLISCYSPSTVFIFIAKDAWICISTTLRIFETKPWHNLFDEIWRQCCRSVDEFSIL